MLANEATQKQLNLTYQRNAITFANNLLLFYEANKDNPNIVDLLVNEYMKFVTQGMTEYASLIDKDNKMVASAVIAGRMSEYDIKKGFAQAHKNEDGSRVANIGKLESQLMFQRTPYETALTLPYRVDKIWNHGGSTTPRSTHVKADGQRRDVADDFKVGGKDVEAPGKFNDPAEDIYCSCFLTIKQIY